MGKIVYENWIVEVSYNPDTDILYNFGKSVLKPNKRAIKAVWRALSKLSKTERDFVKQYYFRGESIQVLALKWDVKPEYLVSLRWRTNKMLKKLLTSFVNEEFSLNLEQDSKCPLCNSSDLAEINDLIRNKRKEETWSAIIKELKDKYKISIKTPQILIGHQKYHIL